MPMRAPRFCKCGVMVAAGSNCPVCTRDRKRSADERRPGARQRGYDTKWDIERAAYLKAHPTCTRQTQAGSLCGAPSTVVHHIVAHKGDMRLFWSRSNWAARCKPCHDRHDQAQEKAPGGVGNFASRQGTGPFQPREFPRNKIIFSGGS